MSTESDWMFVGAGGVAILALAAWQRMRGRWFVSTVLASLGGACIGAAVHLRERAIIAERDRRIMLFRLVIVRNVSDRDVACTDCGAVIPPGHAHEHRTD